MCAGDSTLNFNERSVLELLKAHVQWQTDSIDALQRKAQFNFTTVNVLAAIVAGFNIDSVPAAELPLITCTRVVLLVLMGALYCSVAWFSIGALWVRTQRTHPMEPSKTNVNDWSKCTPEHHKKILMESYLIVFDDNAKIVAEIAGKVTRSHKLILVAIVLFMLQALILLSPVVDILTRLLTENL